MMYTKVIMRKLGCNFLSALRGGAAMKRGLIALAAVMVSFCGIADTTVTTIPENGTLYIGGAAADPLNKGFIIFEPGSTLVVTQMNAVLNVWATLVATNGAATLEFRGTAEPGLRSHVFACGEGSLAVSGANAVYLGNATYQPVYDVANMTMSSSAGDGIVMGSTCTMLSLPNRWSVANSAKIWLCGETDMFPGGDVVELSSGNWILANNTAIPAAKPIRVRHPASLAVLPRKVEGRDDIVANFPEMVPMQYVDSAAFTNHNSIVLVPSGDNLPTLIFSNRVEAVCAGSLSGTGVVSAVGFAQSYSASSPLRVGLAGDNAGFCGTILLEKAFTEFSFGHPNAAGSATVKLNAANCTLTGVEDLDASVDVEDSSGKMTFAGGGKFSFVDHSFTNIVAHWFDFSRVDTQFYPGYGSSNPKPTWKYDNVYPLVERVVDWRNPEATYSFWNRRMYKSDGGLDYVSSVYGCRKSDAGASGDMSYIAFPQGRLPFSDGNGYTSYRKAIPVQMVIMVFGSQYGGGNAIVGTDNGAFGRTGKTTSDGITTNTSHSIWVDGVQVDPTAASLNGAWQVITVSMDGEPLDGIGWNSWVKDSTYGGQCYGEIMIFTESVTEKQRLSAESYLSEKWGLTSQYSAAAAARLAELKAAVTNHVMVCGGAAVKANEDTVQLDGICTGTLELSGGVAVVGKRPYEESEVPSEGRLFWLDADDESTLVRWKDVGKATCVNQVLAVRNKASSGFVAGEPVAYGTGNRAPTWVKSVRGTCPERGWIDFNEWYGSDVNGNCLRFYNYYEGILDSSSLATMATMNTRTALIAQDSSHGGGLPLLDDLSASGSIKTRDGASSLPMWRNGSPTQFANGENRLNGQTVDQTKGFSGGPEVFTVRGTASLNVPFIDYYGHTENRSYEAGKGAVIGEMLYYSTPLSDDVVSGLEAYLMKKWLGRLPDGFSDVGGATILGSGSVSVADAVGRPNLGVSYSGVYELSGDGRLSMEIDPSTGEVHGALVAPNATFKLPSSCTIDVSFTSRPHVREKVSYTLVDCATMDGEVSWTFNRGANVPSYARFVQSGNKVALEIIEQGLLIIFR